MSIVLHQFEFSHFNEKARWALAYKGIEHRRESYLPGPHMMYIRRLSGQVQTPVMVVNDDVVTGSASIIDRLEHDQPSPALYPADARQREEALAVQAHFDREVGPATRTVIFSALIEEEDYLCSMFARAASPLKQRLYRATLPLAKPMIAKGNGTTDPANIRRSFELTEKTLDEVAQRTAGSGYMVGDAFSVADLAAASLLAPIANPVHPDMSRPKPIPAKVATIVEGFANHPGVAWVNRMYAQHR